MLPRHIHVLEDCPLPDTFFFSLGIGDRANASVSCLLPHIVSFNQTTKCTSELAPFPARIEEKVRRCLVPHRISIVSVRGSNTGSDLSPSPLRTLPFLHVWYPTTGTRTVSVWICSPLSIAEDHSSPPHERVEKPFFLRGDCLDLPFTPGIVLTT